MLKYGDGLPMEAIRSAGWTLSGGFAAGDMIFFFFPKLYMEMNDGELAVVLSTGKEKMV